MDILSQSPVTLAFGKAGLSAGTTTTYSIANAVPYAVKGKAFLKAAAANAATPTLDTNTGAAFAPIAANQGAIVVFAVDTTGNVKCTQGGIQALDSAGNFVVSPQFPIFPDNSCPIGYLVLKAGSTAVGNFVFGVSNLSGVTGLTYTFVDVVQIPDRPQVN